MTKGKLNELLHTEEGFRIERTSSTSNMDKFQEDELRTRLAGVYDNFTIRIKSLILSIDYGFYSSRELQLRMNSALTPHELHTSSARYFMGRVLKPAIELGLIVPLYPDTPHHPGQKYRLTELGNTLKFILSEENHEV